MIDVKKVFEKAMLFFYNADYEFAIRYLKKHGYFDTYKIVEYTHTYGDGKTKRWYRIENGVGVLQDVNILFSDGDIAILNCCGSEEVLNILYIIFNDSAYAKRIQYKGIGYFACLHVDEPYSRVLRINELNSNSYKKLPYIVYTLDKMNIKTNQYDFLYSINDIECKIENMVDKMNAKKIIKTDIDTIACKHINI